MNKLGNNILNMTNGNLLDVAAKSKFAFHELDHYGYLKLYAKQRNITIQELVEELENLEIGEDKNEEN